MPNKPECPYLVAIEGHSGKLPRAEVNCNGKYLTFYDGPDGPHPHIQQYCLGGDFRSCEYFVKETSDPLYPVMVKNMSDAENRGGGEEK